MLSEFSTRLSKAIEQKRYKDKLEQDLRAVDKEIEEISTRHKALSAQLHKEKVDVEKLERTSITTLFYSVLGNREQQLEQERQELLSAQLQYQQVQKQMDFLVHEQNILLQRLDELSGVEAEYQALLADKEQLLKYANQAVADDLIQYTERIANLDASLQEITEAIHAGEQVLSGLDQVIKSLESAKNWGIWDMLGGGFISTAIKHSRVDDARKFIDGVERSLSQFRRELIDVEQQINLEIDIGEFDTFADYFFDSLIFDWVVQSKITDSIARAKLAKSKVFQAVRELEVHKRAVHHKQLELQEEQARIIESIL